MESDIYKIIEEYTRTVEIEDSEEEFILIKGRISKSADTGDFMWEISHYCKPDKKAGEVNRPGNETLAFDLIEDARRNLFTYMKEFTGIAVEQNPYY